MSPYQFPNPTIIKVLIAHCLYSKIIGHSTAGNGNMPGKRIRITHKTAYRMMKRQSQQGEQTDQVCIQ